MTDGIYTFSSTNSIEGAEGLLFLRYLHFPLQTANILEVFFSGDTSLLYFLYYTRVFILL